MTTWRSSRCRATGTTVAVVALLATGCMARSSAELAPAPASSTPGDRAVIRSGSLELRAENLETTKEAIDRIVVDVEGRTQSWSLNDDRRLWMTVRIPAAELDAAMDRIATLGKVVGRSLRSVDVAEELIDLEVRLENLQALRARLRSYLDQARTLTEILEVERELTRVQTEIETIEAKLEALRDRVAMSQLDLEVRRRGWF